MLSQKGLQHAAVCSADMAGGRIFWGDTRASLSMHSFLAQDMLLRAKLVRGEKILSEKSVKYQS